MSSRILTLHDADDEHPLRDSTSPTLRRLTSRVGNVSLSCSATFFGGSDENDSFISSPPATPRCFDSPPKSPLSNYALRDATNTSPSNFKKSPKSPSVCKKNIQKGRPSSEEVSPNRNPKRHRRLDLVSSCGMQRSRSTSACEMISGGLLMPFEQNSDGDRVPPVIPCLPGQVAGDYNRIDANTLEAILRGDYDDRIASFRIMDCRFDYEYNGGHIRGAINLTTDQITELDIPEAATLDGKRHVIVMHCEFSSVRGPKSIQILRNFDRVTNLMRGTPWPCCSLPDIYLLDGGYKKFFETHKHLCTPQAYVPELSENFRRNRADSKKTRKNQLRQSGSLSNLMTTSPRTSLTMSTSSLCMSNTISLDGELAFDAMIHS